MSCPVIPLYPFLAEHRHLVRVIGSLHMQVAHLAERGQVPPFAVRLIAVEMMDGENALFVIADVATPIITRHGEAGPLVRMAAAHAAPVRRGFDAQRDLRPVGRVVVHCVTPAVSAVRCGVCGVQPCVLSAGGLPAG